MMTMMIRAIEPEYIRLEQSMALLERCKAFIAAELEQQITHSELAQFLAEISYFLEGLVTVEVLLPFANTYSHD